MLLSKFFFFSVMLATAVCACDDRAAISNTVRVDGAAATLLQYEDGHYASGFRTYQLNMTDGRLEGSWYRREIVEGKVMRVNQKESLLLSEAQLSSIKKMLGDLNDAMFAVSSSKCGIIADGGSQSLVVTMNQKPEIQVKIAEVDLLTSICADAYVPNKSLLPFVILFGSSFSQFEDTLMNQEASGVETLSR